MTFQEQLQDKVIRLRRAGYVPISFRIGNFSLWEFICLQVGVHVWWFATREVEGVPDTAIKESWIRASDYKLVETLRICIGGWNVEDFLKAADAMYADEVTP